MLRFNMHTVNTSKSLTQLQLRGTRGAHPVRLQRARLRDGHPVRRAAAANDLATAPAMVPPPEEAEEHRPARLAAAATAHVHARGGGGVRQPAALWVVARAELRTATT